LNYLAGAERPVGEIVAALGLEQPSVSKHLRVLRDVGLVRMRRLAAKSCTGPTPMRSGRCMSGRNLRALLAASAESSEGTRRSDDSAKARQI